MYNDLSDLTDIDIRNLSRENLFRCIDDVSKSTDTYAFLYMANVFNYAEEIKDKELFEYLYNTCLNNRRFIGKPAVINAIMGSSFLNKEQVIKFLERGFLSQKVIDLPFFDEDCAKTFFSADYSINNPAIGYLFRKGLITSDVLSVIIDSNVFKEDTEEVLFPKLIEYPNLQSSDVYKLLVINKKHIDSLPFRSEEVIDARNNRRSLLSLPVIDKPTFEKIVKEKVVPYSLLIDEKTTPEYLNIILENIDVSDETTLKSCINAAQCDSSILASVVKKLIESGKSPDSYVDLLDKISKSDKFDASVSKAFTHYLNNAKTNAFSSSSVTNIFSSLLDKNDLSNEVLLHIARMENLPDTLVKKVLNHPNKNGKTEYSVRIMKKNLTDEDYGFISNYAITDTSEKKMLLWKHSDIKTIKFMNEHNMFDSTLNEVLSYLLEDKKLDKESILYIAKECKSLDEDVLSKMCSTANYDDLIVIANNPNSRINVVEAMLQRVDNITSTENSGVKSTKEEVLKAIKDTRQRVIEDVFDIEKEDSYTEMLRANVEDGFSTMLWGKSGVGKSSRVFEIDPTATKIVLKNGMLPEEIIGCKDPNDSTKVVPPHWYKVLCDKCYAEPNRKHILFIDEVTNVNDTIKNNVWEVVGDRMVAGYEEWRLPPNCSIVLAGNRPEESSAVRVDSAGGVLPAPFHNRVDSMIEIEFDINEWAQWALEIDDDTLRPNVNPYVYAFLLSNYEKAMFTDFDPEDITKPFLTPRKWETLSKALYKAEDRGGNHRHVSYARIKSIIGDGDIYDAFIALYEKEPLDIDKVQRGEYSPKDFAKEEDKFLAMSFLLASDVDPMAAEVFVETCLGKEKLKTYQVMSNMKASIKKDKTVKAA